MIRQNTHNTEDLIYPTREISSFFCDLCSVADLDSIAKANFRYREFLIEAFLQTLDTVFFHRRTTEELRLEVLAEKKNKHLYEHFCSLDFLLKLSKSDISPESRTKIAMILVLTSRMFHKEDRLSRNIKRTVDKYTESGIKHASKVWLAAFEMPIPDEVRRMIAYFMHSDKDFAKGPLSKLRANVPNPKAGRGRGKLAIEERDFMLSFNRLLTHHKPLNIIRPTTADSAKNESVGQ